MQRVQGRSLVRVLPVRRLWSISEEDWAPWSPAFGLSAFSPCPADLVQVAGSPASLYGFLRALPLTPHMESDVLPSSGNMFQVQNKGAGTAGAPALWRHQSLSLLHLICGIETLQERVLELLLAKIPAYSEDSLLVLPHAVGDEPQAVNLASLILGHLRWIDFVVNSKVGRVRSRV